MDDVGFPDFAPPYFFNATSLPHSNLDRVSARYEAQAVTPWLANLSLTAHYQRTERLLQNQLPVQFPAPTAVEFFPISVFRLDILSETGTARLDAGPRPSGRLRAGDEPRAHDRPDLLSRPQQRRAHHDDHHVDGRPGGARPARSRADRLSHRRFQLGPPSVAHPVRVPDASLRDVAVFAQDEWRLRANLSLVAGLRGDFYRVTTEATPGYDVVVGRGRRAAGDRPVHASRPERRDLREAGAHRRHRSGRQHRRAASARSCASAGAIAIPNLEEMLFAGPATTGSIAPNVKVKPEQGNNFDAGAKFNCRRVSGGAYVFVNQYKDFVVQDLTTATTPAGPLVQTTNYADVRIHGLELAADAPVITRPGILSFSASGAFTRGTITRGINPLDGSALDGEPADNITPLKVLASAQVHRAVPGAGGWSMESARRPRSPGSRRPC